MKLSAEDIKQILSWWEHVQDATGEPDDELPQADLLTRLREELQNFRVADPEEKLKEDNP